MNTPRTRNELTRMVRNMEFNRQFLSPDDIAGHDIAINTLKKKLEKYNDHDNYERTGGGAMILRELDINEKKAAKDDKIDK